MSLNHKRRIFRPDPGLLSGFGGAFPPLSVILAGVCSAVGVLVAVWLFGGPSGAPAHAPESQHLVASSDHLVVVDGDTLRLGDQVVRLQGIAAPAHESVCVTEAGATADCGVIAANALASLMHGSSIDCAVQDHDAMGRAVANCWSAGVLLNEAMVRDGWARAQVGHTDLRQTETAARAAGRGIWRNQGAHPEG